MFNQVEEKVLSNILGFVWTVTPAADARIEGIPIIGVEFPKSRGGIYRPIARRFQDERPVRSVENR